MAIFSDIVWEGGFFGTFHSARLGRNALARLVHSTPSHMVHSTPSHVVHSTPLQVAFLIRHKWLSKPALSIVLEFVQKNSETASALDGLNCRNLPSSCLF